MSLARRQEEAVERIRENLAQARTLVIEAAKDADAENWIEIHREVMAALAAVDDATDKTTERALVNQMQREAEDEPRRRLPALKRIK